MHPGEDHFLARVAQEFGFTDQEYLAIKGRHFRCGLYDPYNILSASPKATDAELKSQYHRLVAENHPDMLMARGRARRGHRYRHEKARGHQCGL